MKIYIDDECKCHTTNPDSTFREFEVPFFDGKCSAFVEGYRYCPAGESYVNENGEKFSGECVVPWKPWSELDNAQREHERKLLAEYAEALKVVGVEV
jgi:hypothetical protein